MHIGKTAYNPARHLHTLLTSFLRAGANSNVKAEQQWRKILGLPEGARIDVVLEAYGRVVSLPGRTRRLVEVMPKTELVDDYTSALAQIENAFTRLNLDHSVKMYVGQINSVAMTHLKHAAATVDRLFISGEAVLDEDQLTSLRRQVEELLEAVANANDLEPVLRAFMLRHLDAISRGLRLYKIDGVAALVDAWDQFVGHCAREPGVADRASRTSWGKRMGVALTLVWQMINIGTGLPELVETYVPTDDAIEIEADAQPDTTDLDNRTHDGDVLKPGE